MTSFPVTPRPAARFFDGQPDPQAIWAALNRDAVAAVLLLKLDFRSGPVFLSNYGFPITDTRWGHEWIGLGELVGMADIAGGPDNLAPLREYSLGLPYDLLTDDSTPTRAMSRLPDLIGAPAEYRNRSADLLMQFLDMGQTDTHGRALPLGHPQEIAIGVMDTVSISFGPSSAVVTLSVEEMMARKGLPVHGLLTHADQQRRSPGDNGLRYVPQLLSTTTQWTKF